MIPVCFVLLLPVLVLFFLPQVYGLAQSMDSLESSHPVEIEVNTPEEINEIL